MKKFFAVLMTLALMLAMAAPVFAAESAQMTISASKSTASPGDTIDFTVSISQVDDCRSGGIVISYDQSVFEYVSGQCLVSGAAMSDFSGGTGVFAFSEGAGVSGNIFRFTLKIRTDAPIGSTWVSGSPSVRTGAGQISCGVSGASITVSCEHTYGGWSDAGSSHQRVCSKCGGTDTAAHTWDAGTVTKAATCKETGSKTVTCTGCGTVSTEAIAATDEHSWGSCKTMDGSTHKHTCSVCGKENTSTHTWDAGTVTKAPTCKEEGTKTYACTACGTTTTETVAKTNNHTWGGYATSSGSNHKRTCSTCGKEDTSRHSWNSGKVTKAASCKESGVMSYTCTACGAATTESIAKSTVHTYDHDCDSECNICGVSREISHAYDTAWTRDETSHWHDCSVCGAADDAAAHDFENSCATSCLTCGHTRETAHDYGQEWQTDEKGHWQICQECGAVSEAEAHIPGENATEETAQVCTVCAWELVPALGHSFSEVWGSSEENHWHECACGEKADEAPHAWDDGLENEDRSVTYSCTVCGAQRTEEPQGLSPAALTVLIISLIGIGGGLLAWFLRKKKS